MGIQAVYVNHLLPDQGKRLDLSGKPMQFGISYDHHTPQIEMQSIVFT